MSEIATQNYIYEAFVFKLARVLEIVKFINIQFVETLKTCKNSLLEKERSTIAILNLVVENVSKNNNSNFLKSLLFLLLFALFSIH